MSSVGFIEEKVEQQTVQVAVCFVSGARRSLKLSVAKAASLVANKIRQTRQMPFDVICYSINSQYLLLDATNIEQIEVGVNDHEEFEKAVNACL